MSDQELRVHAFLHYSRANGPGLRAVIWVQACTLGCPGCFNPETHSIGGGESVAVDELWARIAKLGDGIDGITITGGEPFQQAPALLDLLRRIRTQSTLSVILSTGYAWEEVQSLPQAEALLSRIDVLIAGRYDQSRRLAHGLRGSANKTVHCLTDRHTHEDILSTPPAEVIITTTGEIIASGIDQAPPPRPRGTGEKDSLPAAPSTAPEGVTDFDPLPLRRRGAGPERNQHVSG